MDTTLAIVFCIILYPVLTAVFIYMKDLALWVVAVLTCLAGALVSNSFYHDPEFWAGADPVWYVAASAGFLIVLMPCVLITGIMILSIRENRYKQGKGEKINSQAAR